PPGIVPNFVNPPSRVHVIFAVYIVTAIIPTLFTGLRFYTARFVTQHVRVDDYRVLTKYFLATQYGFGRHLWDIPISVFNLNFMKATITGTFYGISIMLTKLSILTVFIQFAPWGNIRIAIYIIIAVVVVYSPLASFEGVYACRPIEKYWDLTVTGGSCINWLKITVFSGVMNTTTDAAILILPFLLLRNLRLPKRQKIGVIIMLMTGGFILIVSIIRLKLTADMANTTDLTWESVPSIVWWTIEVHIAIVCACLPAGKPFLRRYMPNIIGSSYGASVGIKRRTTHFTHARHLPSRDAGEEPQDIILEEGLNSELWRHTWIADRLAKHRDIGKSPADVSTTTVELATRHIVRAEYGSDKGLIIIDSRGPENDDSEHLPTRQLTLLNALAGEIYLSPGIRCN
ncbi:hypothetical protein B0J11DRAFT_447650, partial [Dendryphion nanum]